MKNDDIKHWEIPGLICPCKGCRDERQALENQFNHKFYKDAEVFREEIKQDTLKKAAKKYPEPFNPHNWSIEELARHAMAENYDQQNYIYGMYEVLKEQEKRIKFLEDDNARLRIRLMFLQSLSEDIRQKLIAASSQKYAGLSDGRTLQELTLKELLELEGPGDD